MTKPEFGLVDPLKPMPILWTDREEKNVWQVRSTLKLAFLL